MDLIIKAYLVKNIEKVEEFNICVNETNQLLVRRKLESEYKNIVNLFKLMKEQGLIKSIYIPKNKRMNIEISNLIRIKKDIKNSISKISNLFR